MKLGHLESLRARLMLLVALALVPAIALTAYSAIEQRDLQTSEIEYTNLRVARLVAADQVGLAENARDVLTALSYVPALTSGNVDACGSALRGMSLDFTYVNLGVADSTGRIICSLSELPAHHNDELLRAQSTGDYTIGDYDTHAENGTSTLSFLLPVRRGNFEGVFFATADTTWLDEQVADATLREGALVLILDDTGRVIASYPPNPERIGTTLSDSPLAKSASSGFEGYQTSAGEDGVERIYAFTPLLTGSHPTQVAVGEPKATALAGVSASFARDMTTLVVVGAIALGVAWVASDVYILRHMRQLVAATLRLRSGVMTARSGIPRGHGEFSQLARWFDEMAASLEREHEELRRLGKLELYRLLAENATDVISRLTPHGSILYASPACERLLGYPSQLMPGRFLTGLSHPEDVEATRLALARAIESPQHVTVAHRMRRRDGGFVWLETTVQGVRDASGTTTELIAVSRDITERKRSEESLERAWQASEIAAKAKSEFLANMSHEIRTPMNAVIGMTSLLSDSNLDAEQREFTETIRASGDHLLNIINDILDFSKIESQRLELEQHPFDLRATVEESLDLVTGAAAEKGLELLYDIVPGTPDIVEGDAGRIRQVLVNLLGNAVKFTEKGEVIVRARSRKLDDERYEITFTVQDTGIGIPADRIERLFKPFFQVDASTTRQYGGSGLGLAISRHLCDLMGGTIHVESESGKGSKFTFTIKVAASPLHIPVHHQIPEAGLAGRRALIVDDNATNRRILSLQLRRWGMITREAPSADEAIAWVERGDAFDIALLDLRMPGMDGAQLSAELRRLCGADIFPLILLSSLGRGREALRASGARFEATLSKPIKPQQLHDTLVRVLRGSHQPEPAAPASAFDAKMAAGHPLRILLAEDNAINQKVAVRLLERLGYKTDLAATGQEAVASIARQDYDLILMDIQMPEMDGLEATRRIRGEHGRRPRIVAMTAHASPEDRDRCIEAGMDDYVTKPIRTDQLIAALRRTPSRSPLPNPPGEAS